MLDITQSADIMVDTTLTAFFKAVLVTSTGSMIPPLIILTCLPDITSNPQPSFKGSTESSMLAFSNIVLYGARIALNKIFSQSLEGSIFWEAFSNAIPPPDIIPSFNAALTAYIAVFYTILLLFQLHLRVCTHSYDTDRSR